MQKTISTFFLSIMCCMTVSAQSSYFNTVNQKEEIITKDTCDVPRVIDIEEPKDTKSFLASLSLTELEYLSEKYIHDHFNQFLKQTSLPSSKAKKGNEAILKMYDGEKRPLTISNLLDVMNEAGVSHRLFVLAQALLETGYFRSNACRNYNNLFGLTNPHTHKLYRFTDWESSVVAYKKFVQYKYKGGSYLSFLRKIGYAEDPSYISKVVSIARQINKGKTFVD